MIVVHSAALAVLTLGTLVGQPTNRGFECTRSDDFCLVSVHWTQRTIPYVIRHPDTSRYDETQATSAVMEGLRQWSDVPCSDVDFEPLGVLPPGAPAATDNEIIFQADVWEFDPAAAGVTKVFYNTANGEIVKAVLNINERDTTIVTTTSSCTSGHDLASVITHEVGHYLGIAHPCEYAALITDEPACPINVDCVDLISSFEPGRLPTMWPTIDECDDQLSTLENEEIGALCYIYPAASADRQCYQIPDSSGGESIVKNTAFGCTSTSGEPALLLLLGLIAMQAKRAARRRRA